MYRGTIKDRVRAYLDRTDLDTKIREWIDDTRLDLALKYPFKYLYIEATASTVAGTSKYAMPDDYLGHLVLWCGQKKLMKASPREWDELTYTDHEATVAPRRVPVEGGTSSDESTTSGPPDYYIERGMELELYPVPDSVYTLRIKYFASPTTWYTSGEATATTTSNDNTAKDYITTFHPEAVIWGTALRGAIYLDDEAKKQNFSAAYDAAIKEMIQREKRFESEDQHVRFKTYKDFDLTTFKRMVRVTV